jgi:hypothetical protein
MPAAAQTQQEPQQLVSRHSFSVFNRMVSCLDTDKFSQIFKGCSVQKTWLKLKNPVLARRMAHPESFLDRP